MCGIVGTLVFEGQDHRVNSELLTRMRDTMALRGPDGAGLWISDDAKVGLGHRRLSIIDLSETANQPMCNEDGSIWIVFNGEIYNHQVIRSELEKERKYKWKTDHSDTEVIVHAFEEWGIACIEKFRGMFAFALWDQKKNEMWLVRDRIGIKPLYYSNFNGKINFASEIKALLEDPEQKRAVHEEALFHYLSFLTTPAPQTLFDGIKKLPGGCWLKIDRAGKTHFKRYWDPWDHTKPLTGASEEEISSLVRKELEGAVRLRKVSDVPVGVFLSGGIDSSTNAALFSDGQGGPVKTFTIGYEGKYDSYQNELHYARQMADLVGADHHEVLLTIDDLINFLPQMVKLQDEPIADPVCVPVYYVSKLARDNGVTVCQVGEGADELFWGYQGWKTALNLQNWNNIPVPRFLKKLGLRYLERRGASGDMRYEYLRRATEGQPIFWGGAEAFNNTEKHRLLSPRLKEKFRGYTSWEVLRPIRERFEAKAWDTSHLNWMTYIDLNLRLPELLLMRVDKMSMGVSLEGRVPFLDHKFVELALSIPASAKTKNGTLKYILKKAVRGLIPDELIDRKKQGFGVPVHEWFFDRLGPQMKKELDDFCRQTDYLDKTMVDWLFEKQRGTQIWFLFNLAMWWKTYIA